MSELVNTKSSIQSKIPSGNFNALFDLSGSWLDDAMDTKHLAFDGYFISLYDLRLTASPLILRDEVKKAVPSKWDPASLTRYFLQYVPSDDILCNNLITMTFCSSRYWLWIELPASFIKTYGTHIIVAASVGGQDVVCVRQKHSSPISTNDLKMHLEDLGDFLFSDGRSPPVHRLSREGRRKVNILRWYIIAHGCLSICIYASDGSNAILLLHRFLMCLVKYYNQITCSCRFRWNLHLKTYVRSSFC